MRFGFRLSMSSGQNQHSFYNVMLRKCVLQLFFKGTYGHNCLHTFFHRAHFLFFASTPDLFCDLSLSACTSHITSYMCFFTWYSSCAECIVVFQYNVDQHKNCFFSIGRACEKGSYCQEIVGDRLRALSYYNTKCPNKYLYN